ncbi:MAG TPA: DUF2970 domain-containing protein [Halomonas sp.]|nr:DUF2970 domain-containing protein [Halomonas sp.]
MWRVIKSVLAAFFGVQKETSREEDFQRQSAAPFILAAIVLGIVLIITLVTVASRVAG